MLPDILFVSSPVICRVRVVIESVGHGSIIESEFALSEDGSRIEYLTHLTQGRQDGSRVRYRTSKISRRDLSIHFYRVFGTLAICFLPTIYIYRSSLVVLKLGSMASFQGVHSGLGKAGKFQENLGKHEINQVSFHILNW